MTTKSYQDITEISWTNEGTQPIESEIGFQKPYLYPWYHWLVKTVSRLINNSIWSKEKFDENDTAISNINTSLDTKVPTSRTINGYDLTENRTLGYADVGAVPTGRKINGYDLTVDRDLTASDVSAIALADQETIETAFMFYSQVLSLQNTSVNKMHILSETAEIPIYAPINAGTLYVLSNPYIYNGISSSMVTTTLGTKWETDLGSAASRKIGLKVGLTNCNLILQGSTNGTDWATIKSDSDYDGETWIETATYRYLRLQIAHYDSGFSRPTSIQVGISSTYSSDVISSSTLIKRTGKVMVIETTEDTDYAAYQKVI